MCFGLPPTVGPVPIHVGPDPLSADDGWVCTFYPAESNEFKYQLLHKLYSVARLWRRLPP